MNHGENVLQHSAHRRKTALNILTELQLLERWGRYGRPVLVGAVAYDLAWDPDIDMEIYCPDLQLEHGFQILSECCATSPNIISAYFENHLHDGDKALYWQLKYRQPDGTTWKMDMWSAPTNYDLPRSEFIVEPMKQALTEETRNAILTLKQQRTTDPTLQCFSIDLYRAVMSDHVRRADELRQWLTTHETGILSGWKPTPKK